MKITKLSLVWRSTLVMLLGILLLLPYAPRTQAFTSSLVMDDAVFDSVNSMSAAQIDNWLNVNFPSSCISTNHGFSAPDPTGYNPSQGFLYGGAVSGGQVIYDAAQAYGINPQVLIATLQKEQSLVTGGAGCDTLAYAAAMGYGCPDGGTSYSYSGVNPALYYINGSAVTSVSGTCVNTAAKAGFSQQVIRAAWLLKFGEQRSEGNTSWAVIKPGWDNSDDPQTCYGGPMTQGYRKRCSTDANPVYYDGYITIDGVNTHMDSGATAALYWYTPHFNGNRNFADNIFTPWFGGTVSAAYYSCHDATNVSGAITGEKVIPNKVSGASDNLSLVIPNNTGSSCIEVHTWLRGNYQAWIQHTATNSPAFNPSSVKILSADLNGDGRDEIYKVDYCGSSGMIEFHGWDPSNQHWVSHIASNHPCVSSSNAEVIAADTNGDGRDEVYFVEYQNNGSGRVEVHGWSNNFQQWVSHIATNYGAINPTSAQVVTADTNGDGRDEFYLVNYSGSSGRVEVHGWSNNFQQWVSHIATNSPSITHVDGSGNSVSDVITADTNSDGRDEFYQVDYTGTGSHMLEIHGWTNNFQQWVSHIATSQGQF